MKQVSETLPLIPQGETLRQAWTIFVFSAMFAVLFNSFYTEGIELKFRPPKPSNLPQVIQDHSVQAPDYVGWNKTPVKTPRVKPTQAPSDNFPRISLIGMKDRLDKQKSVFLDARKPEEYKEGHIPGALNLFANELDHYIPLVVPQLHDKNQEIIAYCHGGDCDLSLLAAKALREAGYNKVEIFEGGWPDWKKSGYPISKGDAP